MENNAQLSELKGYIRRLPTDLSGNRQRRFEELIPGEDGRKPILEVIPRLLEALKLHSREFEVDSRFQDIGTVLHVGDGVATLSGLPRVHVEELVSFPTDVEGMAFSLDHEHVNVILLGPETGIRGGDRVSATDARLRVPVGPHFLGRVVNALGEPLDGLGPIEVSGMRHLERQAPGIIERRPVDTPLHTGIIVIDSMLPIGRGQRELILGDRQTGKTTLAIDAIINQRGKEVACIYVSIAKKDSSVLQYVERLRARGALDHTIVVIASPDDPPALRYLAPFAGCSMGEYLMDQGRDVLIVYDDLKRHADASRELSLLLRRPPGREAYPGDIFYLHSRLLERACQLSEQRGEGSMTALPIVETQRGNISAYIPTNLISITDGQIVLDSDLFNKGIKPAVNVGASVSRVGGEAQTQIMKSLASELRLQLAQYEEVARFARFGTEVDAATREQIHRGERLQTMLTQPPHRPLPLGEQVVFLICYQAGALEEISVDDIHKFRREVTQRIKDEHPKLIEQIGLTGRLSGEDRENLLESIEAILQKWSERTTSP